ncbi:MAG TPA: HlyD family type I secretion periplasmic adaptor subunit [Thiothrix sp.]|nr:HlyD family type I secretion periplasmic adaptor subunit [Thiothrix sp.]
MAKTLKKSEKNNSQALGNVVLEGEIAQTKSDPAAFMLNKSDVPYRIFGVLVLLLTFGVLLYWAATASLHSAVVAQGKVIVASQNKTVQHLDGGIVKEIHVKEGAQVKKGQALLTLDDAQLKAQLDNVKGQLWEIDLDIQRLSAERDGKAKLKLSVKDKPKTKAEKALVADIMATKRELFKSRKRALVSQKAVLDQRLAQSQKQIVGAEEQIASLNRRRDSLQKDVDSVQALATQDLFPRVQMRERERQLEEIRGNLASVKNEIARLQEVISETEHQKILSDDEYVKEVSSLLNDNNRRRIQLQSERELIEDKLSRIVIKAPDSGKVKGLEIVTKGAVIGSGAPIMEIVPNDTNFKVTAQLSPTDIDSVHLGQQAEIRFSAFNNAQYFPVMYAKLIDKSTDTLFDDATQMTYYKVVLKVENEGLDILKKEKVQLVAGMPADITLLVDKRTVLEYLIRPVKRMLEKAFHED